MSRSNAPIQHSVWKISNTAAHTAHSDFACTPQTISLVDVKKAMEGVFTRKQNIVR